VSRAKSALVATERCCSANSSCSSLRVGSEIEGEVAVFPPTSGQSRRTQDERENGEPECPFLSVEVDGKIKSAS
jgi:hypothetical protein